MTRSEGEGVFLASMVRLTPQVEDRHHPEAVLRSGKVGSKLVRYA